jgi:hypothetical protein
MTTSNAQTDQWEHMMFAPRDGTTFYARNKKGKEFGCRYDERKMSFVNTANNHRVNPSGWRAVTKDR